MGSFEIVGNGVVLFSKLKSQLFPDVPAMVKFILNFK
jgi:hypothetical protein